MGHDHRSRPPAASGRSTPAAEDPVRPGVAGDLFGPGRMNGVHAERADAAQSIARRMTVWRKPVEADPAKQEEDTAAGEAAEAGAAEGAEGEAAEAAPAVGLKVFRMPKWNPDQDPDSDDKPQRGQKGQTFRGGGKGDRDKWFGYTDKDFQKWWEREKQKTGGKDLENKAEADAAWAEWVNAGRPKVNK